MKLKRQSADDFQKVLRRWKNPQVPELRRWKNPQVPELRRWKNPQERGADKSDSKKTKKTKKTMYQYSEKISLLRMESILKKCVPWEAEGERISRHQGKITHEKIGTLCTAALKYYDNIIPLSWNEDDSAPCILNSPYWSLIIMETTFVSSLIEEYLKVSKPKS